MKTTINVSLRTVCFIASTFMAMAHLTTQTARASEWVPLSLPSTNSPEYAPAYVFAAAAGRLWIFDTAYDHPGIFVSDTISTSPVWRPVPFDGALLDPCWFQWRPNITSAAFTRSNGQWHLYAGTSGGVFEIVDTPGATNALFAFWPWCWDYSYNLQSVQVNSVSCLLWSVSSFGSQSGYHYKSGTNESQFLNWNQIQLQGNRITDSSTGETFGWSDNRGFIWPGQTLPPLLLSESRYSTDGASTWMGYTNEMGMALQAVRIWAFGDYVFLLHGSYPDYELYHGHIGSRLRLLGLPLAYPSTLFFDENTKLVIAGSGSELYATTLRPVLSIAILGSHAELWWETSSNYTYQAQCHSSLDAGAWTNLGTPVPGSGGTQCIVDPIPPGQTHRFYRVVEFR